MSQSVPVSPAALCPSCQQVGKAVNPQTVKAMLSVSLEAVSAGPYLFCATRDCPVVFFGADSQQVFTQAQVRERVYQKFPDADDTLVCYCFRHTVGEIKTQVAATGRSAVLEAIRSGTQAGKCACDIRNPQGSCCLGNVQALVKCSA